MVITATILIYERPHGASLYLQSEGNVESILAELKTLYKLKFEENRSSFADQIINYLTGKYEHYTQTEEAVEDSDFLYIVRVVANDNKKSIEQIIACRYTASIRKYLVLFTDKREETS